MRGHFGPLKISEWQIKTLYVIRNGVVVPSECERSSAVLILIGNQGTMIDWQGAFVVKMIAICVV